MPELAEVESWRSLSQKTARGQRILQVYASPDTIVFSSVSARRFASVLKGCTVQAAHRRGKHLWWELDQRPWPSFHFGMTGSFCVYDNKSERPAYTKAEFLFESGLRLAMINKRRLGRIRLLKDPESEPPISRLGQDPYHDPFTAKQIEELVGSRKAPIKALLLNQGLFAGVGNWIADEVLFQAKIDPRRSGNTLLPGEHRGLAAKLHHVVSKAVELGAYSGKFPKSWLFHRRWDWKARIAAGEKLAVDTVGGRTTVWDPARQR